MEQDLKSQGQILNKIKVQALVESTVAPDISSYDIH